MRSELSACSTLAPPKTFISDRLTVMTGALASGVGGVGGVEGLEGVSVVSSEPHDVNTVVSIHAVMTNVVARMAATTYLRNAIMLSCILAEADD